jgi:hypothetical protein
MVIILVLEEEKLYCMKFCGIVRHHFFLNVECWSHIRVRCIYIHICFFFWFREILVDRQQNKEMGATGDGDLPKSQQLA